jgi:hypothetical protein
VKTLVSIHVVNDPAIKVRAIGPTVMGEEGGTHLWIIAAAPGSSIQAIMECAAEAMKVPVTTLTARISQELGT